MPKILLASMRRYDRKLKLFPSTFFELKLLTVRKYFYDLIGNKKIKTAEKMYDSWTKCLKVEEKKRCYFTLFNNRSSEFSY